MPETPPPDTTTPRPEPVEVPDTVPLYPVTFVCTSGSHVHVTRADPAAADSSPADEELPQRLFTFKHDAALPDAGPPAAVGSASPGQPLTISAETEPGQEAHLTIVACGQPHQESAYVH